MPILLPITLKASSSRVPPAKNAGQEHSGEEPQKETEMSEMRGADDFVVFFLVPSLVWLLWDLWLFPRLRFWLTFGSFPLGKRHQLRKNQINTMADVLKVLAEKCDVAYKGEDEFNRSREKLVLTKELKKDYRVYRKWVTHAKREFWKAVDLAKRFGFLPKREFTYIDFRDKKPLAWIYPPEPGK